MSAGIRASRFSVQRLRDRSGWESHHVEVGELEIAPDHLAADAPPAQFWVARSLAILCCFVAPVTVNYFGKIREFFRVAFGVGWQGLRRNLASRDRQNFWRGKKVGEY